MMTKPFEVTEWGGVAQVLGQDRPFRYEGDRKRLSFFGVTEEEAKLLLTVLALGGPEVIKAATNAAVMTRAKLEEIEAKVLAEAEARKKDATCKPEPAKAPVVLPIAKAITETFGERYAESKGSAPLPAVKPETSPEPAKPGFTADTCPVCRLILSTTLDGRVFCPTGHWWRNIEAMRAGKSPQSKDECQPRPAPEQTAPVPVQQELPVAPVKGKRTRKATEVPTAAPQLPPAPAAPVAAALPTAPDPWGLVPGGQPVDEDIPFGGAMEAAKTAPKPPAKAPPAANTKDDIDLELLQGKSKLRDVLAYLLTVGFNTPEDLIKVCERFKQEVPVLSRVASLAERIPRTLDVMGWPDNME